MSYKLLSGTFTPLKEAISIPLHWRKTGWCLVLLVLLSLTVFYPTWSTMVEIWMHSRTYNHCFVIAPISAWLIFSKRKLYSPLMPTFSAWALLSIFLFGFLWLVAN